MKVFVLGGTGAIGKPAVAALVAAGHDVTALARTPEKAVLIRDLGGEPVEVSMFDVVALTEVFADHDAVANLASAMPSTSQFMQMRAWRETQRIRTDGSAAVADAALAAGVRTLIQESVCMLYADHGSAWVDESAPVDHYRMAIGNHAAEASAQRRGRTERARASVASGSRLPSSTGKNADICSTMVARPRVSFSSCPSR